MVARPQRKCKGKGMTDRMVKPFGASTHPKAPLRAGLRAGALLHLLRCGALMVCSALLGCGSAPPNTPPSLSELCTAPSLNQKIIGGQACPGLNDKVALLELFDEEDNVTRCTALVTGPQTIVTAAHCFDEFVFRAKVALGSEEREVIGVTNHPQAALRGDRFDYDVSVAHLDRPFERPVPPTVLAAPPLPGATVYVFGFGRTSTTPGGPLSERTLYGGTTTVSARDTLFIESFYDGSGANPCRGDSGGPAFVYEPSRDELGLIGVVSSGVIESCAPGDTTIFSNLTSPALRPFLAAEAPELTLPES